MNKFDSDYSCHKCSRDTRLKDAVWIQVNENPMQGYVVCKMCSMKIKAVK